MLSSHSIHNLIPYFQYSAHEKNIPVELAAASCAYQEGKLKDAIDIYQAVIKNWDTFKGASTLQKGISYYNLGVAYKGMGLIDLAIYSFMQGWVLQKEAGYLKANFYDPHYDINIRVTAFFKENNTIDLLSIIKAKLSTPRQIFLLKLCLMIDSEPNPLSEQVNYLTLKQAELKDEFTIQLIHMLTVQGKNQYNEINATLDELTAAQKYFAEAKELAQGIPNRPQDSLQWKLNLYYCMGDVCLCLANKNVYTDKNINDAIKYYTEAMQIFASGVYGYFQCGQAYEFKWRRGDEASLNQAIEYYVKGLTLEQKFEKKNKQFEHQLFLLLIETKAILKKEIFDQAIKVLPLDKQEILNPIEKPPLPIMISNHKFNDKYANYLDDYYEEAVLLYYMTVMNHKYFFKRYQDIVKGISNLFKDGDIKNIFENTNLNFLIKAIKHLHCADRIHLLNQIYFKENNLLRLHLQAACSKEEWNELMLFIKENLMAYYSIVNINPIYEKIYAEFGYLF